MTSLSVVGYVVLSGMTLERYSINHWIHHLLMMMIIFRRLDARIQVVCFILFYFILIDGLLEP